MPIDVADLGYRRGKGDQTFSVVLPRLTLDRGEVVALTGESGSGKSTVLELLGLVAEPLAGARFRWRDARGGTVDVAALWRAGAQGGLARLRAAGIGFVMQTGGLLPYLTVRENLRVNRRLLGLPLADPVMEGLIADLEIGHLLDKHPAQLSVGQQQRVSIGRALAHRPALLLADEPSSALDPRLADKVLALLLDLAGRLGTAVVIATHERGRVRDLGLREIRAMPWHGDTGYGSRFEE